MRTATLRAYVQVAPDSGFLQDERYGFAGALAEWLPSHRVTVGAYATVIRSVTDRAPLPNGGAVNDFRLTERTATLGGTILFRPRPHWLLEGWLGRMWRPERRVYRQGAVPDVNYADVSWSGQAVVMDRPSQGFTGSVGLDLDRRVMGRRYGDGPAFLNRQGRRNSAKLADFLWCVPHLELLR